MVSKHIQSLSINRDDRTVIPAVAYSPYIPRGLEIIFRKLFLIDPSVFKGSRGFSAGAPVTLLPEKPKQIER